MLWNVFQLVPSMGQLYHEHEVSLSNMEIEQVSPKLHIILENLAE